MSGRAHGENWESGAIPRIDSVNGEILSLEMDLQRAGVREPVNVDICSAPGFHIWISWSQDSKTGYWNLMHDNSWDVRRVDPETGEHEWTRRRETRPLRECSLFQQLNARPYVGMILRIITKRMKRKALLELRPPEFAHDGSRLNGSVSRIARSR